MLALLKNNTLVSVISEGERLDVEDMVVSPAMDGWSVGEYSLKTITPAPPLLKNQYVASKSIVVENGQPKYKTVVENIPILIPTELRKWMPNMPQKLFRDGLIDNNLFPSLVEAAIRALPTQEDVERALNSWNYSKEFIRVDPYLDQIGYLLGLTPDMIDTLWLNKLGLTPLDVSILSDPKYSRKT